MQGKAKEPGIKKTKGGGGGAEKKTAPIQEQQQKCASEYVLI